MIEPGLITADALDAVRRLIEPGMTTLQLDAEAARVIGGRGEVELPDGARLPPHDLRVRQRAGGARHPERPRSAAWGDILSIDAGAEFQGWNGDSAFTVIVPGRRPKRSSPPAVACRRSPRLAVGGYRRPQPRDPPRRVVGAAIQAYIEQHAPDGGYGILRDYVGHGIGRKMHESPSIFQLRGRRSRPEVRPGLAVAIEPMVVIGDQQTLVEDDGWTVSTVDGTDGSTGNIVSPCMMGESGSSRSRRRCRENGAVRRGAEGDRLMMMAALSEVHELVRDRQHGGLSVVVVLIIGGVVFFANSQATSPGTLPQSSAVDTETGAILGRLGRERRSTPTSTSCARCANPSSRPTDPPCSSSADDSTSR